MPSSSLYERYKPETRKQLICPALVCIRDTNQKLENNQHAQLQSISEIQTRNQITINMPSSSLYQRYKPEIRIQLTCPALVCISDTNQKLENNQHAQLQSVSEIQTRNQNQRDFSTKTLVHSMYRPEFQISIASYVQYIYNQTVKRVQYTK